MKRITVKVLAVTLAAAMTAIMSTACLSVTEAGETTSGTLATTTEVDNRETEETTTEETTTTAKPVSKSEFDIQEYKYENSIGDTLYFLVVKNNSNQAVGISFNMVAYDKKNNTIGAADGSINVIGPGEESIGTCYFDSVKGIDHVEYDLSFDDAPYYEPVIGKLEVVKNINKKNVVVTVTNKGEKPAQFVEAYALFFNKQGKIIGYRSAYLTDNDSEIKPGAKRSAQLGVYKGFNTVKVYFTGRAEAD